MPRTCFVIMPFPTTASCSEEEWTDIFNKLFKPAIENAGLDYECRRSTATRGNIVAGILQDLRDAYVVLADVTDRNPNVFYELGVRHSFSDRSIMVAQKREDIPFDLQAYANHVYDWKTEGGRAELAEKLRQLLTEVDNNPDRPDNPVSDFLRQGQRLEPVQSAERVSIAPAEAATAQPLAGPGAKGLDAIVFARRLAREGSPTVLSPVLRLTRNELRPLMMDALRELNARPVPASIQEEQIPAVAAEYVAFMEPHVRVIEEFVLACVEQDWGPGARLGLQLAGEWISLSERGEGHRVRFAQGVPALLAWRLLVLMGAKAVADEAFESLTVIMREPIEVEHLGNRMSYLALPHRRDLFHPEAFLGYATHGIRYIGSLWQNNPQLHRLFGSEEDYHLAVSMFLMIVALEDAKSEEGYPLYPGYRLLPQALRAMNKLCGRLYASEDYLTKIARTLVESPVDFRTSWSRRVAWANSAELGGGFFPRSGVRFPDPMATRVEEW